MSDEVDVNDNEIEQLAHVINEFKLKKYIISLSWLKTNKEESQLIKHVGNGFAVHFEVMDFTMDGAIAQAMTLSRSDKAETIMRLTKFVHKKGQDIEMAIDYIDHLRRDNVIEDFMLDEPTSVQARLESDEEILNTVSRNIVAKEIEGIADDFESYLQGKEEE